jgi:hypothetical protein
LRAKRGNLPLFLFHSVKPEGHGAALGRNQLLSRKKTQKVQKEAGA